jgi:FAD-dependent monooxygenase
LNTLFNPISNDTAGEIMSSDPKLVDQPEALSDDTVLIVGGGPVGLLLATVLSFYGVKSVLLERNKATTK